MRTILLAASCAALFLGTTVAAQPVLLPAESPLAPMPARDGPEYAPGWDKMTPQERDAYREKRLAAPTRDECRRMRDEQLEKAATAGRKRATQGLPEPQSDACN